MNKIILGNRYELRGKIAEGGMSTIYKAYCNVLNRIVCVKILKSEFSEDEEFLIKFNNEAKAAAALNHPNIINVYDVGKDDDIAYIVMEYVDGKNLKQIVREEGPLDEHFVLNIARQICLALNEAHSNRIIHRDIKPHNIMISKSGIIKVGDFGIARAVNSTTITTVGDVMGSVHYFSPEQARGGFVDERTDIYSLGIVMYELLIGSPPYDADTPIAVALKHLHEQVTIPESAKEYISESVQKLILKLTQKNIEKRYKNVSEVIMEIDRILGKEEDDTYLNTITYKDDKEFTKVIPAIQDGRDYPRNYDNSYNYEEKANNKDDGKIRRRKKRRSNIFAVKPALFVGILIAVVMMFVLYTFGIFDFIFGSKTITPDLSGKTLEEATEILSDSKLQIEIMSYEESETVEENGIIRQFPLEGTKIGKGEQVTVVVSSGLNNSLVLEDYKDKNAQNIKLELEEKGIIVLLEDINSEEVEEGRIVSQSPSKNSKVSQGDTVKLYVSMGSEDVLLEVPDFIGKSLQDAQSSISESKFAMGGISTKEDDTVEENTVLEQNPVASTKVKENTPINLVVSKKTSILTKNIGIVLPKREMVNVTLIEKSTGETVYNQSISTINGNENLSVELTGKAGQTKQIDIYLDGQFHATTAPITF